MLSKHVAPSPGRVIAKRSEHAPQDDDAVVRIVNVSQEM